MLFRSLQSKALATIILDAPVEFDETRLLMSQPDQARLKKLFEELEFRTFAQRVFTHFSLQERSSSDTGLLGTGSAKGTADLFSGHDFSPLKPETDELQNIHNSPHQYQTADTPEKRAALIAHLSRQPSFCLDTETTGLDANEAELVGMSFAWKPGEAWWVPVPDQYQEALAVAAEFKNVLERVFHNGP